MKILRKILGLNKLLKERGELREELIVLKDYMELDKEELEKARAALKECISELEEKKEERERERRMYWDEESRYLTAINEYAETVERLKKDKEEIIESLANIDGFRGIKTLLNNMIQPTLTKEK